MKKILKWVKNNLLGFIICAVMFSAIGVVAATLISSSEVSYNNANSGSSATTVKGALDELYNMAQNCTSGSTGSSTAYYVYGWPYSSRSTTDYNNVTDEDGNKRKIFLRYQNNKLAACLIKDNKLECFEEGNANYETFHAMQIFNGDCTNISGTIRCGYSTTEGITWVALSTTNGVLTTYEIFNGASTNCSIAKYSNGVTYGACS